MQSGHRGRGGLNGLHGPVAPMEAPATKQPSRSGKTEQSLDQIGQLLGEVGKAPAPAMSNKGALTRHDDGQLCSAAYRPPRLAHPGGRIPPEGVQQIDNPAGFGHLTIAGEDDPKGGIHPQRFGAYHAAEKCQCKNSYS